MSDLENNPEPELSTEERFKQTVEKNQITKAKKQIKYKYQT